MAQGYYLDELIKREIYSQAVFLGLINSVAREPPTSPPRWAFQSIPGIRKGITRFIAIKLPASLRFAPIRLPVTANAPKRPKIIPEAPTANVLSGLNRYEASEPLIKDVSKIKIYLFLP